MDKVIFKRSRNSLSDIFSKHKDQIDRNRINKKQYYEGLPAQIKQISLDSVVVGDVQIGEKGQVSKSSIGRGVIIGKNTKISNSIIYNNVKIGNE